MRKERQPKACASGGDENHHPWAVADQAVVKPFAASAIALDPCRGWGRNPSARICVQKEPDVSPAGTGIEYRRPRRGLLAARAQGAGRPLRGGRKPPISGAA